ncbi:hypothetical protein KG136_002714 [Salmonella enterica subsp. enterica serovar Braenderup]|nr:hypothetical protein [Salmonella enterica subsp. enterica serovar Braenderup]EHM7742171.1 hypothetical protein [Salmonella enterica subsp. enterica serovar Braenderup]HCM3552940.1 hypothetical protein [Salmonella enterica subsp. enterica serovar Minnesota]
MIYCSCAERRGSARRALRRLKAFLGWMDKHRVLIGLATLMIPTTVAATLQREVVVEGQGSNLYITAFRKFLHNQWYGPHPVTVRITAPAGAKFNRDVCSYIKATYKYGDYGKYNDEQELHSVATSDGYLECAVTMDTALGPMRDLYLIAERDIFVASTEQRDASHGFSASYSCQIYGSNDMSGPVSLTTKVETPSWTVRGETFDATLTDTEQYARVLLLNAVKYPNVPEPRLFFTVSASLSDPEFLDYLTFRMDFNEFVADGRSVQNNFNQFFKYRDVEVRAKKAKRGAQTVRVTFNLSFL